MEKITLMLFGFAAEKVTEQPPEWVFRMRAFTASGKDPELQLRLSSQELQEIVDVFTSMRPMIESLDSLTSVKPG